MLLYQSEPGSEVVSDFRLRSVTDTNRMKHKLMLLSYYKTKKIHLIIANSEFEKFSFGNHFVSNISCETIFLLNRQLFCDKT